MLRLASKKIGHHEPPFIIAEMSGNHQQSLDQALKIVEAAAESGVDALKLQTYTAETMTLNCADEDFFINDPNSLWAGRSLYELYHEAHTPWAWHAPIMERANALGLIVFSTPFDASAVDFLEALEVPAYKVASFENTDLPLIQKIAATGKPMIISTGMASLLEIDEAVETARAAGCQDLILLKCTSAYPAPPEEANLRTLADLREQFNCEVGLSDHTLGNATAIAAIALGATVIEKHFTLARASGGVDAAFSLEPAEMKALVVEGRSAWASLGRVSYTPTATELASKRFRRSLYVVQDLEAGELFTRDNVRAIRPGFGLPPKYLDKVLGKRASRAIRRGEALSFEHFK